MEIRPELWEGRGDAAGVWAGTGLKCPIWEEQTRVFRKVSHS